MNLQAIREVLQATPFTRFRIRMASGRKLKVEHPDFISIDPGGRTVIVFKLDGDWEAVDIPLVNSIELHVAKGKRKAG